MSAKLASYVKFYQNNKDFIDSLGKYWVLIGLVFVCFEGKTGMSMSHYTWHTYFKSWQDLMMKG